LATGFQGAALAIASPGDALTLALARALAHSGKMKARFDHEELNVDQASLEFVTWATDLLSKLDFKAAVKDQLNRASTSIPLNIAEGNGKFAGAVAVFLILLAVQRWNARAAQMCWSRST
jgi:hypothetical protein